MSPSAWGFVQPGTFQVPGLQLGRWKKSCQQKSRMEVMNQGFLETKLFQHWLQTWKRQILLYKIVLYNLYTWGLLDGWIARTWTSNSLSASGIYGSVVRRWSTFFGQYHYPSNSFSPCTWYQYVGFIQDSGAQMTIGWIPPNNDKLYISMGFGTPNGPLRYQNVAEPQTYTIQLQHTTNHHSLWI